MLAIFFNAEKPAYSDCDRFEEVLSNIADNYDIDISTPPTHSTPYFCPYTQVACVKQQGAGKPLAVASVELYADYIERENERKREHNERVFRRFKKYGRSQSYKRAML